MHPENQHYVPQLLLRNFVAENSGFLWTFDKKDLKIFSAGTRNVAAENGFYDFEFNGTMLSIESALTDLETKASTIIANIVNDRSIYNLSEDNRRIVAHFMAVQLLRTKRSRESLIQVNRAIQEKWGAAIENSEKDFPTMNDEEAKKTAIRSIIGDSGEFSLHFLDKAWVLLETNVEHPFCISDEPVSLQNSRDFGFFGNLGIAVPGIEIYCPLSSTLTLAFMCDSHLKIVEDIYRKFLKVRKANFWMMEKKQAEETQRIYDAFTGKVTHLIGAEEVRRLNSLQVLNSYRFVFSRTDCFALVREMLAAGHGTFGQSIMQID